MNDVLWRYKGGYGPAADHAGRVFYLVDDQVYRPADLTADEQWPRRIGGWRLGCTAPDCLHATRIRRYDGLRYHLRRAEDHLPAKPPYVPRRLLKPLERDWLEHVHREVPELGVYEATQALAHAKTMLARAVGKAREGGAAWRAVGAAAGMSRQAAQERWGGRSPG